MIIIPLEYAYVLVVSRERLWI